MAKDYFTVEDLRRWQQQGLISEEQLASIVAGEGLAPGTATAEKRHGLNLVSVAYYFGGFLALLSFTFFLAAGWEDLSDAARLIITVVAMLVIGALGGWLRFRRDYATAGGLLLFVATAIFPFFVYTFAELVGIWPDTSSFSKLSYALLYLSLVSLPVALAMLFFTRFSLISLLSAGLVHLAAMTVAEITDAAGDAVSAAVCGAIVLAGLGLTLAGRKSDSFWLKLYGLIGLQISFTIVFFRSDSDLMGILFLVVSLAMVGLSLRFREVVYLVFGAIGFYTYVIKLVMDTFEGTVYFPLLLGFIGISIVILAVLYQRYRNRLFRGGSNIVDAGSPPEEG